MSDNPENNKILIKFEIHVPVGSGQPPVIINAPAKPDSDPAPRQTAFVTMVGHGLNVPGSTANVKTTAQGTSGAICVTAHENPDAFDRIPVDVYCKIVSATDPIPHDPTVSTVGATRATKDNGSDYTNWHIDLLSTAQCAWAGSGTNLPYNELVVWRQFEGETFWTIEIRSFRGKCALTTDCENMVAAVQVLDAFPVAVEIQAKGFGGKLTPLNGRWQLPRVEKAAAGKVAWASGGDGVVQPRVQLHGQSCDCQSMSLELACGGQRLVYTLGGTAFQPQGENRFSWCRQQSAPRDCAFPAELVVTPARGDA